MILKKGDEIKLEELLRVVKYQRTKEMTSGDNGVVQHVLRSKSVEYHVSPLPTGEDIFSPYVYRVEVVRRI